MFDGYVGIGLHYVAALEAADGTNAMTFYMEITAGQWVVKYLG
jgi:hypothetical protein